MAVFQLNKEKALGPDGFTIAVYQECWDVIKEDLMRVFLEFHTNGIINQTTNATFIAMVPKKSQTFKISDYRPISLVTSLYKIIAKVLSGHLCKVLHETIYGSQGAFVEGRHILDAMLIANEWWMRKEVDVLSRLMIRAEETGLTEGFFVGRDRTRVSLLQFADDTIFCSKASLEHLQNLKIILLVFGQVSGLKINLEKNTILGINTRPSIGGNPKTIGFWDPVVERISRSRPKELGGLGFGKTSLRNSALLGKWLWRCPRERNGLWHKVIGSIYGTHPNGQDANMVVKWSHRCPWKAIAQVF
ncbi:Transposon TX1 uncharacterized 149 kDa protein [Vitis vinifera]|uniref:Transposon TX1 uncharacterized 149 kDa protein n=1 Tax=Vitis vinifera TaxID=29760 RepID=A0A438K643_VITVI|nr:Transposon TX1 uncharacterized 149 kDa protein [Vitis vinifera]